jgi:hypothetical protein
MIRLGLLTHNRQTQSGAACLLLLCIQGAYGDVWALFCSMALFNGAGSASFQTRLVMMSELPLQMEFSTQSSKGHTRRRPVY